MDVGDQTGTGIAFGNPENEQWLGTRRSPRRSARMRGSFDADRKVMHDPLLIIARALGCPHRLLLLRLLGTNGLSVTEAATAAGIAPSTACHHLGRLVAAGLATQKRRGRCSIYAWPKRRLSFVYSESEPAVVTDRRS